MNMRNLLGKIRFRLFEKDSIINISVNNLLIKSFKNKYKVLIVKNGKTMYTFKVRNGCLAQLARVPA